MKYKYKFTKYYDKKIKANCMWWPWTTKQS